jgi:hypothetical protein
MKDDWAEALKLLDKDGALSAEQKRQLFAACFSQALASSSPPEWESFRQGISLSWPGLGEGEAVASFLLLCEDPKALAWVGGCPAAEEAKNALMNKMAEFIAFAAIQRRNLSKDAAFNRHIAHAVDEMNAAIRALCALRADSQELFFLFGKYGDFTASINSRECWEKYWALKGMPSFDEYQEGQRERFLSMLRMGKLNPEAVRPYVEGGDPAFRRELASLYEEMLEEDPIMAAQILSSGLLGEKA